MSTTLFISYSRKNLTFAERLARDLRDAGFDVWIDFRRIKAGEEWVEAIIDGVRQADVLVVCLSADSIASDTVRVWRVNHFGGHVFAPTLLDMPKGDSWAFVDEDVADSIATRSGDLDDVTRRYRGWSGCDTRFAEAAERAVWQREGWAWQAYDKQTHTYNIEETRQPTFADVRIEYTSSDGATRGVYEAHVVIEKHIATIPSTGSADEHAYPQYRVTDIERVP